MMKRTAILILMIIFSVNSFAHEKITFKNKESFNQACESGKFCSTFDLISLSQGGGLKEAGQLVSDNPDIFQGSYDGTIVHLEILKSQPDRAIYEKLFYTMGLFEIEILEGEAKGTYSVEAFLDLYDF
jgi:hypothetical protein